MTVDYKCPIINGSTVLYAHITNGADSEHVYCRLGCDDPGLYKLIITDAYDNTQQICYHYQEEVEGYYISSGEYVQCDSICRGCKGGATSCTGCNWDIPYLLTTKDNPTMGTCVSTCNRTNDYKDETDSTNFKCYEDSGCPSTLFRLDDIRSCHRTFSY